MDAKTPASRSEREEPKTLVLGELVAFQESVGFDPRCRGKRKGRRTKVPLTRTPATGRSRTAPGRRPFGARDQALPLLIQEPCGSGLRFSSESSYLTLARRSNFRFQAVVRPGCYRTQMLAIADCNIIPRICLSRWPKMGGDTWWLTGSVGLDQLGQARSR